VIEHKMFSVFKETPMERNRMGNKTLVLLKSEQVKIIWESLQICSSSCRGIIDIKDESLRLNLKTFKGRRL